MFGDVAFNKDSGQGEFPEPTIEPCTDESRDRMLGQVCVDSSDCQDGCYCNGVEICVPVGKETMKRWKGDDEALKAWRRLM